MIGHFRLALWVGLAGFGAMDAGVVGATEERPPSVRCATPTLRALAGDARWAAPGEARQAGVLPCDHTPVGPPPNPGIGDSWDWYLWRLGGFPVADVRTCTVRGMGDHCYVVVENSQWNVNVDQTDVDLIVDAFENQSIGSFPEQGIWDLDTGHFGDPPDDLDQDPRVYIVYYDLDISADGFFWAFDQECDDVADFHSNECDVVYMNCSDFSPSGDYLLAVLAHEFEHLIHYNHDPNESAWVDEGVAELAMWLYGNPDTISAFNANPDRSLLTFDGSWSDYIKSYLWNLYFYERAGGQPAVRALVAQPANDIAGYDAVLDAIGHPQNFDGLFSDWVVANFLDDPSIGDGRFGYTGETLPPFQPFATWSSYPVGPFGSSVQHWACDYVRYLDGDDLLLTFDGADNNRFAVRVMLLDDVNPTEVVDMVLSSGQAGSVSLPQVGSTHDIAVVAHAGIQTTGGMTYTYGATSDVVGVASLGEMGSTPSLVAAPSPGGVLFTVVFPSEARDARLEVFDVSGRRVASLFEGVASAGRHEIAWTAPFWGPGAGVYFARLFVGGNVATTRALVVR